MKSNQNVLTLECPHCERGHADDYECLEGGRPGLMQCENAACRREFAFLIHECLECGEESVFAWTSTPPTETLALLSCNDCGAPFDEAASEGEKKGPAQRL